MNLLIVDTCDGRGSVAVLRDGGIVSLESHPSGEDYSSWLISACNRVLASSNLTISQADAYVVASGPGSITGLLVGLTTVKAWSELFRRPILPVSRLEAIASEVTRKDGFVASFCDAQRGQVFGALIEKVGAGHQRRREDEIVIPPGEFVNWVVRLAGEAQVIWASPDLGMLDSVAGFKRRWENGDLMHEVSFPLGPALGLLGLAQLESGRFTDALHLDANYVRRSDAEIHWKKAGMPTHV